MSHAHNFESTPEFFDGAMKALSLRGNPQHSCTIAGPQSGGFSAPAPSTTLAFTPG